MTRILVATALLLLPLATHATAQIDTGVSEINRNGHITATAPEAGDTETIIQAQLRHGYSFTPVIEAGFLLSATKSEDVDTFGEVGVFGAYHVAPAGATSVPYAGVQLGSGFGYEGDNPFTFGGFVALNYFLAPPGPSPRSCSWPGPPPTTSRRCSTGMGGDLGVHGRKLTRPRGPASRGHNGAGACVTQSIEPDVAAVGVPERTL